MKTEIQFSIIYPSHTENDINKFEFFIRMAPADGKNIISVVSVPKFSIDGRVVKHLHFLREFRAIVRIAKYSDDYIPACTIRGNR